MINLVIPGRPRPKGRPRFNNKGFVYTPSNTRQHEKYVRELALDIVDKPLEGDLILNVTVVIKNRNHGDLDNYVKLVSDALNGIAYQDDKQIKELHGYLYYDKDERTEVEIKRIA